MIHWIIYADKYGYTARRFVNFKPTNVTMFSNDLKEVHNYLKYMNLKLQPQDKIDDPQILEYWT